MKKDKVIKLSEKDISDELRLVNNWNLNSDLKGINKTFIFSNFREAFSWMTYISLEAEKNNHHPDWKNIYNKVIVNLSTHDVDGLSYKDFILAKVMDSYYSKFNI
tara:strand:+ start:1304 stop:1618 length:315 start_codon:yes stop_codon:yes gene_type:complete